MGCGTSSIMAEDAAGNDRPQFDYMGFNQMDISAINNTFQKFEKDEDGKALIPSVLEFYKIRKNRFMERTFTLLHVGRDEDVPSVTFKQFVYLLWNFCTLGDKMALYAFSVYDSDRSDTMDTDETNTMLKDIYGKFYASSGHGKKMNRKIQKLGKNGLGRAQFEEFALENEDLLMVPNKYLKKICARTLGSERWQQITAVRQEMNQNEFMDIYDFLSILNSKTGSDIQFVTLAEHTANVKKNEYMKKMEINRIKAEEKQAKRDAQRMK